MAVPLNHALARFVALYNTRLVATTRPYEGVVEMLEDASTLAQTRGADQQAAKPTERLLDAFDLRSTSRMSWLATATCRASPIRPD